jgi:hypothetical protein
LSRAHRCRACRADAQGVSAHHPCLVPAPARWAPRGLEPRETAPAPRPADCSRRRYGATGGVVDALRRRSGRIPPLWVLSSAKNQRGTQTQIDGKQSWDSMRRLGPRRDRCRCPGRS